MECVQGALKLTPQICFHENASIVSSDDFFVDQLLDLSNQDQFLHQEDDEILDDDDDDDKPSASAAHQLHHNSLISDVPSLPSTELSVPADDLASLEWLSHFVEDSFSGFSAPFPSAGISALVKSSEEAAAAEVKREAHGSLSPPQPCFKTPVPVKARSKRTRNGGRVWCLRSPSFTESSSSSTTSSSSSSPVSPWLFPHNSDQKIPASKKRLPADKARAFGAHAQPPRRCSHCGVQKTPQWRTGPLGAKTLCNACGVRFKSGRLLPEYRPACSPTFSSDLHSNHHRKVLEMRRNKETTGASDDAVPAPPALPSF